MTSITQYLKIKGLDGKIKYNDHKKSLRKYRKGIFSALSTALSTGKAIASGELKSLVFILHHLRYYFIPFETFKQGIEAFEKKLAGNKKRSQRKHK